MVSVGCRLARQVMVASMMADGRAGDVRDRVDCPNQQQDNGQHPQQPMRQRSSYRPEIRLRQDVRPLLVTLEW
jgi:hypothetical protein